jgi:lysophospholipase L1-like esterase
MANRRENRTYKKTPLPAVAIGDSLTRNYSTQTLLAEFWPTRLQALLEDAGVYVRFVNAGVSGNTTRQMFDRRAALTNRAVPGLAVIFGGVNDPGSPICTVASNGTTGDTFVTTGSTGAYQLSEGAGITINGNDYTLTDIVPTGVSISPPLVANITTGNTLYHATSLNIQAISDYLIAAGCDYIAIVSAQYLNFASNTGDTLATDYAVYAPVRAAQLAASVALAAANPTKNFAFVDLHAHMKALIVGGEVSQGYDYAWHVATSDQHLNAEGQQIVADAIYAAISAAGWIQELS